jgi:hypothetical protein
MKKFELYTYKDESFLKLEDEFNIAPKFYLFLGLDWHISYEMPLRKRPDRDYHRYFSATLSIFKYRFCFSIRFNKMNYTNFDTWMEQRKARIIARSKE